MNPRPIVLAISGASGMLYAVRCLKFLLQADFHVELVCSKAAYLVWRDEMETTVPQNLIDQGDFWRDQTQTDAGKLICHGFANVGATIASGSYRTQGMLIVPCSMSTVAKLAHGLSSDLLERAADVQLKEGRRVVVVPRETPFSVIHLRNLLLLAEAGVRVVPAIPAWYQKPRTIEELVDFVVGRALDQLDIDHALFDRWRGICARPEA
ncbi:flavin prenyltransferase UbiX [Candidatus Cyanaurora vandensis]|uniref:flavin prenyltransferase UbiX n=1 Tax=Candidatus Cyanaurora vandensis TaxID=2714958 RepID=UPI002580E22E|nr:flavin prenyltransferase UbiX [Candidatus Cyanaurora vandensis]